MRTNYIKIINNDVTIFISRYRKVEFRNRWVKKIAEFENKLVVNITDVIDLTTKEG